MVSPYFKLACFLTMGQYQCKVNKIGQSPERRRQNNIQMNIGIFFFLHFLQKFKYCVHLYGQRVSYSSQFISAIMFSIFKQMWQPLLFQIMHMDLRFYWNLFNTKNTPLCSSSKHLYNKKIYLNLVWKE